MRPNERGEGESGGGGGDAPVVGENAKMFSPIKYFTSTVGKLFSPTSKPAPPKVKVRVRARDTRVRANIPMIIFGVCRYFPRAHR